MNRLQAIVIETADQLRARAEAWDVLWRRSEVVLPTVRAETLALWLEQFAAGKRFRAVVIEQDGRLLAALPLTTRRIKRLASVADLPNNPWAVGGDLLLDPDSDVPAVLDLLLTEVARGRWPLLWLEDVEVESPRWNAFFQATQRARWSYEVRGLRDVALIDIGDDWNRFTAGLSAKFYKDLKRRARRLEKQGDVQLRIVSQLRPSDVDDALRRAFEVERQSWKGAAGTSIIQTPGMLEFFSRQARALADWGQLRLYFLEMDGEPIAFEYGYLSGGVFFAHKISYLEEFAKASPGNLLRWKMLEHMFSSGDFSSGDSSSGDSSSGDSSSGDVRVLDNFGELTDSMKKWMTRSYRVARVVLAPPRLVSRAMLAAYRRLKPQSEDDRPNPTAPTSNSSDSPPTAPAIAPPIETGGAPPPPMTTTPQ